jgi:cell filamentation protein, protein adenylyltransferase
VTDDPYSYPPDFTVLRNRLNERNPEHLALFERNYSRVRAERGVPTGDFDADHLKSIHKHLFQDIYDWAGEFRTVDLGKGDTVFLPVNRLEIALNDIHARIEKSGQLRGRTPEQFANDAAEIIGDLNYAHPFREGNGRTQLAFLKGLSIQAGHAIDISKLDKTAWIDASVASCRADPSYEKMAACIKSIIGIEKDRAERRISDLLTAQKRNSREIER